ncbi:unnamed protein product [[Candida] boidinii]|nr:unnamed protein product [[Candida] boidinii]
MQWIPTQIMPKFKAKTKTKTKIKAKLDNSSSSSNNNKDNNNYNKEYHNYLKIACLFQPIHQIINIK